MSGAVLGTIRRQPIPPGSGHGHHTGHADHLDGRTVMLVYQDNAAARFKPRCIEWPPMHSGLKVPRSTRRDFFASTTAEL
jgi:hypothetical protein